MGLLNLEVQILNQLNQTFAEITYDKKIVQKCNLQKERLILEEGFKLLEPNNVLMVL